MAVEAYLFFNGNCQEVVEYYAEVFGLEKPKMMMFGHMPPNPAFPLPEAAKNLIMYTCLAIKGSNVMFSDVFPGTPFTQGDNITLALGSDNIEEIKSFFAKLKEGGSVKAELQETFFSKCYGIVTDKFGITWQLSHSVPPTI